MDRAYEDYLKRHGQREKVAEQKRARLAKTPRGLDGVPLEEEEEASGATAAPVQAPAHEVPALKVLCVLCCVCYALSVIQTWVAALSWIVLIAMEVSAPRQILLDCTILAGEHSTEYRSGSDCWLKYCRLFRHCRPACTCMQS